MKPRCRWQSCAADDIFLERNSLCSFLFEDRCGHRQVTAEIIHSWISWFQRTSISLVKRLQPHFQYDGSAYISRVSSLLANCKQTNFAAAQSRNSERWSPAGCRIFWPFIGLPSNRRLLRLFFLPLYEQCGDYPIWAQGISARLWGWRCPQARPVYTQK